jgi:hypothetical protein
VVAVDGEAVVEEDDDDEIKSHGKTRTLAQQSNFGRFGYGCTGPSTDLRYSGRREDGAVRGR